jgi:hypothetical protein
MNERSLLLASLAETISDYRVGEIPIPTPEHVNRWVQQFGKEVQLPLLSEVDHVLKKTYFSKSSVGHFFGNLIGQEKIAGDKLQEFWRAVHVLDIQQHGHSQTEIRKLFSESLKDQLKIQIDESGLAGGAFVYLDDVLFSGGRIGTDLSAWIVNEAPDRVTIHIVVIATHRLGEWQCMERLKKVAVQAGKAIDLHCWAAARFENRLARRNTSEVLWPISVSDDPALQAYVAEEQRYPFRPRQPGGKSEHAIFSSEKGRQTLEREMLHAGMRIRSFSRNPNHFLRPLGFSAFGLGFGSMFATYRNCPNNTPLALWWGDPDAAPGHPFRNWYPLLPRKTYAP